MDKEYFIQLTTQIYYLTSLFPKKEPLRYKIREVADEILGSQALFLNYNNKKTENMITGAERNLEVLDNFLKIAKAQNWVSPAEILKVQEEYSKIGEELKAFLQVKVFSETETAKIQPSNKGHNEVSEEQISQRQERILEILKEKEQIQVKDLKPVFPYLSKRTLRRDFEQLLRRGLVIRIGEKNNTFYKVS